MRDGGYLRGESVKGTVDDFKQARGEGRIEADDFTQILERFIRIVQGRLQFEID
jgi:hypothetical protein